MRNRPPRMPRLSTEPLRAAGWTIAHLADHAGLCRKQIHGEVTIIIADKLATAMGVHPSSIWGAEWWTASRAQFERASRWPAQPLLDLGYTRAQILRAAGTDGILHGSTPDDLSTVMARRVCDGLGLDPGDVWPEFEWVSP